MSVLGKLPFHDEKAAFEYLEGALWPDGTVCPHCGTIGNATKLAGKATRIGVWKCKSKECRKQFTVKVGTVFEHGRLPLHKFLQAAYLLCCSKKGISAHQLHRVLQISYKAAWFLAHRIREAMRDGELLPPMGQGGTPVEVDETYIGRLKGVKVRQGSRYHKNTVLALVDRESGKMRSFHIDAARADQIAPIIQRNIAKEARLMTDEATWYTKLGAQFASHETVDHSREEYARGDVTTNTVEGCFSLFKRGMKGVYQHCAEKHLHRYLAEFDFRYNQRVALGVDDAERTTKALQGMVGKRLTYRAPNVATAG